MGMNCPIDGTQLAITERQGVEIDYCPQCRGVWLDRGELDKIIEKSEQDQRPLHSRPVPSSEYQPPRKDYYDDDSRREHHDPRYYKKKKRESFLGDLFDF